MLRPDVIDVDTVVVSHEHLDHLDLELLAGLPPEVPVVVPRYPSTILQRRLRGVGRSQVVVLDAWERYPLGHNGADWMAVIPEQCPMSHDAAVLIHVAGRTVLHTNDARISVAQARRAMAEISGPIDLMDVQMSGASWHPVCYEYDDDEQDLISASKRVGKFKAVTRLVRSVQPRMVMPYAGPPCFLDEQLFEHNSGLHGPGLFPDQHEALGWLTEHLPQQPSTYCLPGDTIELDTLAITRDEHWAGFQLDGSASERRAYLTEYAERRRPHIERILVDHPEPGLESKLGERFKEHFESLGTLSQYFLARIGLTLRFEVRGPVGGTWDAHIGPDDIWVDLDGGTGPCSYRLTVDARWLHGVVTGRIRWEELLLSLRFSARREPDLYNDYLVGLLKHADVAALRAVEEFEAARDPGEMVDLKVDTGVVRVSRYCPHAGEDLAEGSIVVDGVLRCLGHNFEFDLRTGECLNARCDPVNVSQTPP